MRPPCNKSDFNSDNLYEFNKFQIENLRREAEDLKKNFSTQFYQTIGGCAAILAWGFGTTHGSYAPNSVLILLGLVAVIAVCLAIAQIGCHTYSTINRIAAYEIHLARIHDYYECKTIMESAAVELRRIDWEEAMFAWRMVMPIIYEYFYVKVPFLDIALKRFKTGASAPKADGVQDKIGTYPWYDTRELLKSPQLEVEIGKMYIEGYSAGQGRPDAKIKDAIGHLDFRPGFYLQKILSVLHFLTALCIAMLFQASLTIWERPDSVGGLDIGNAKYVLALNIAVAMIFVGSCIGAIITIREQDNRRKVMESGLLSIQTSAFVWRIVCITHLVAKLRALEENKNRKTQAYHGYTWKLAAVATYDLRNKLDDIQNWLREKEEYINDKIEKLRT